jgi:hypothetical protein
VAVIGDKGNVYMELVAKGCVCRAMWQLWGIREMYIWS